MGRLVTARMIVEDSSAEAHQSVSEKDNHAIYRRSDLIRRRGD
jgi:hypothetical protein